MSPLPCADSCELIRGARSIGSSKFFYAGIRGGIRGHNHPEHKFGTWHRAGDQQLLLPGLRQSSTLL
jgi:hypothetical protein